MLYMSTMPYIHLSISSLFRCIPVPVRWVWHPRACDSVASSQASPSGSTVLSYVSNFQHAKHAVVPRTSKSKVSCMGGQQPVDTQLFVGNFATCVCIRCPNQPSMNCIPNVIEISSPKRIKVDLSDAPTPTLQNADKTLR